MSDIFNLATKFGKAAFGHAKDGFKKVDEETFKNRMDICKKCEYYNAESDKCNNCGCFLKIKASWNSEKCPIDKW
jgi:hypothetical protein